MTTTLELERERKKRESLEEREQEICRKLELIEFRSSVLCRVKEKFNSDLDKAMEDVYKLTPVETLVTSLDYASGEIEVLKEMKDELEKELKGVKEKIQSCKVDALGHEKFGGHTPT